MQRGAATGKRIRDLPIALDKLSHGSRGGVYWDVTGAILNLVKWIRKRSSRQVYSLIGSSWSEKAHGQADARTGCMACRARPERRCLRQSRNWYSDTGSKLRAEGSRSHLS